ncbi:hypothetical protein G6L58_00375 [Agrobacterium tumefaciens]|nr:hypothetical protein [Agrobacterium tumefaciens]
MGLCAAGSCAGAESGPPEIRQAVDLWLLRAGFSHPRCAAASCSCSCCT